MMKKLLFTLMFFAFATMSFAQTTFYWVGGATGDWTVGSNWKTTLGGGGTSRSSANYTTDILVIDGTNIGAGATGTVTPSNIGGSGSQVLGQLILQNGANVILQRTASSGAGSITVSGGTGDDLLIDATSSLKFTSATTGYSLTLIMGTGSTGKISGTLSFIDNGFGNAAIKTTTVGLISFLSGSKCYINNTTTGDYPFGTGITIPNVSFQSGSTCYYLGGLSPFSQTSANFPVEFLSGSNFELQAGISGTSNVFAKHYFGNVTISNNATVDLDGYFYNIENLTVNSGSTFNLNTTGGHPISGNIVNNGTIGAKSGYTSSNLIMVNTAPKTISGSGTFNDIGTFTLATGAEVTLSNNLTVSLGTSNMMGKLNIGTNKINSISTTVGSGDINIRTAASATTGGNLTSGSNTITLDALAYSGSINTANVLSGALVTGTGIPSNSYIISTSSGTSTITISKPATLTTTLNSSAITISNNPATISISNSEGMDAAFTATGASAIITYGTGTNYIFNATTASPFSLNSNNTIGNVTFNADVTTNKSSTFSGVLTLNNSKLTVRTQDIVTVNSTGSIVGGSTTSFINTQGNVKISGISVATTIPVGYGTNYLPVILTPANASDFSINVFNGATTDATSTGTAITDKTNIVDAIWNVNRTSGTGNCLVTLAWPASLEGASFTALSNSQIGIAQYTGGSYSSFAGSGDNTANTATYTFSDANFGPLSVGQLTALPVKLTSFAASKQGVAVQLKWTTASEQNNAYFEVQRSTDGKSFATIGTKVGAGNSNVVLNYFFTDHVPSSGVNYYRLNQVDLDGKSTLSNPIAIDFGFESASMIVYTDLNPSILNVNIKAETGSAGKLIVYNIAGQKMLEQAVTLNSGNNEIGIQLPDIKKGIYVAAYQSGNQILTQKFIR